MVICVVEDCVQCCKSEHWLGGLQQEVYWREEGERIKQRIVERAKELNKKSLRERDRK